MSGSIDAFWRHARFTACCLLAAASAACSAHGGAVPQGGLPPTTTSSLGDAIGQVDDLNPTTAPIVYIDDVIGSIGKWESAAI